VAKGRRAAVTTGSACVDAVVIGAGPAGSLAATLLARAGLGVMLVERRAFPRRKVCGGCLNPHALAALGRAGLETRVRALDASPVNRLQLHHRGRRVEVGLPEGVAVSRAALDNALAAAAAEAGCDVLFESAAAVDPRIDETAGHAVRVVRLRGRAGRTERIHARTVVVADGLGHPSLLLCPDFQSAPAAGSRVGLGGDAFAGALDIEHGAITMAVSRYGYAGAVAVEGGRVNIAAAVDPAFLKSCPSPALAVEQILDDAGVQHALPLGSIDWAGTPPLTRRLIDPAARGIFVIGDAAGYVEPFTGEGMAWAFAAAEAVVPFIVQSLRLEDGRAERQWVARRARLLRRDQRWCRLLALSLRRSALVGPAVALLSRHPGAAAPFLARFSTGPRQPLKRSA
jgi:flavin-dependent dehydrogenase